MTDFRVIIPQIVKVTTAIFIFARNRFRIKPVGFTEAVPLASLSPCLSVTQLPNQHFRLKVREKSSRT
eukprot:CAMPEP_0195256138 /NCGR_PEP_ID=MMETSP0706-20130129/6056_1 /TAXON_ID=33640 /ORGANISM="Asterionellopsis glacialis, Strain CCMP134" /LENGTH=67 /DNA_ID=CAMNT_0040309121 /DNA_START=398 /DNA_END=598 /DNA_ORIENTATION=+